MADDGARGASRTRSPFVGRVLTAAAAVLVIVLVASGCGSDGVQATTGTTAGSDRHSAGTATALAEPAPSSPGTGTNSVDASDATGAPIPVEAPTSTGVPPAATGATTPDPAPAAPAPYPIGTVALDLVDRSRPTVSGGATIASSRSLPTVVAYPTGSGGPFPLLVFAHGFRLGPPGYTRLIGALAAEGYVVAAPSFPLADEAVAGSRVDRGDLPNQPGDLSYVIDQVIGASTDPASPLAGRVDGTRIGAVGHSDGADTVLDLGYHPARVDGRVRAVVALSPDAVVAPGGQVGASTPLLLEHGDADPVVPYSESVAVFSAVPARRWFLTLRGAGHLEPVAQTTAWTPILDATVVAFLDRFVAGAPLTDAAIAAPAATSTVATLEVAG